MRSPTNSSAGCESSVTDQSSDANIENLLEQVDEYDWGNEEDWEDVGTQQGPDTSSFQKNGWYPFGKLENIIATMIYGLARKRISRSQYEAIHSAVSLVGLKLPTYKTLKNMLKCVKKILGLKLVTSISPLDNACHSLPIEDIVRLDLAKPHVAQKLSFYPAISKDGVIKPL
ncbi:uncharacterized protein MELLADRAFT_111568 [Melampsora larici-populina 98AG31]|uniref:Uncharacterized protein n=1 Tax=Melampsora larici-populina (strain 98AG31 / pathotype 3-4-7) TaxID=747676 RepID=F4S3M0_MELLP|nr:uncharacterized protein MELLADRAFT_111568 [Melampsora larici-populina 98AG31]EGG00695.1 hypothetical protein MELLADRAFT_111568 [Melampsora larici-populina 98AG31]